MEEPLKYNVVVSHIPCGTLVSGSVCRSENVDSVGGGGGMMDGKTARNM